MLIMDLPSTSTDGSRTLTAIAPLPDHDLVEEQQSLALGTLLLHGGSRRRRRQRVEWSEDVVDNEGCGRKKSKSESRL